jgi:hypothetical protein
MRARRLTRIPRNQGIRGWCNRLLNPLGFVAFKINKLAEKTDLAAASPIRDELALDSFQHRLNRAIWTKIVLCQPLAIKKLRLVFMS